MDIVKIINTKDENGFTPDLDKLNNDGAYCVPLYINSEYKHFDCYDWKG